MWQIAKNVHRKGHTEMEQAALRGGDRKIKIPSEDFGRAKPSLSGIGVTRDINAATRELGIDRTKAQRAGKVAA